MNKMCLEQMNALILTIAREKIDPRIRKRPMHVEQNEC